jgi:hypothetical protein
MTLGGLLVISIFLALYMIPAIIAYRRHHISRRQIGVYNLLVGWNPVIWGAAFAWALDGDVETREAVSPHEPILMQPIAWPWLVVIGVATLVLAVLFG